MALSAARTASSIADALEEAGLIAGDTPEEIATNKAASLAIWQIVTSALWVEMTTYAQLNAAQAATAIPVSVNTTTGIGATTAPGTVTGGII